MARVDRRAAVLTPHRHLQVAYQPKRYIDAATVYAMILYFRNQLADAEEVMTSIKSLHDRVRCLM